MLNPRKYILLGLACFFAMAMQAKTYIVSIGVNDYSRFPAKCSNLALPVNDARDFAAVYPDNGKVEKRVLLDSKATKKNILEAMDALYSKAGRGDEVILYFSGHGWEDGVCAYDGEVSFADVRKAMGKSHAKRKLIFSDSCHSGGIRRDAKKAAKAQKQAKNADVMLMMSARDNESAIENRKMRNGYFTHFLVKGLKGAADANNDKSVSAKEIFDYVHYSVKKATRGKQHPVVWGNFPVDMSLVKRK